MPDIVTFLLVEFDKATAPGTPREVRKAVLTSGGGIVEDSLASDDQRGLVAAEFPLAMDATRAVLRLAPSGAARDPTMRAVLYTSGWLSGASGARALELTCAAELLRQARPAQILTSASTAVLIGPGLPPEVELVALRNRPSGAASSADHIYELRTVADEPAGIGRAGEPARHRDTGASNLAWARRAAAVPVLGREDSMAALASGWRKTLRGDHRTALVLGESGIGKTALAAELALEAHAEGGLVLYGRWDRERFAPHQGLREALGGYASRCSIPQLRRDLEDHQDHIRRLLPEVAARLGHRSVVAGSDHEDDRLALYEAVEAWLARLATQRPVLLILDDLHWAERSSVVLVDHLRQSAHAVPWMLVVTARPSGIDASAGTEGSRTLTTWMTSTDVQQIELRGLTALTICHLVERMLGCRIEPDDEAVEWLATETAGNPLLVQQILRGIRHTSDVRAGLLSARGRLPEPATEVIRWRLGHLPVQARRSLADAAVIGSTIDLDLVASVTSTPLVTLRSVLEPALREDLIRGDLAADHYHFTHEVIRRALHAEVDAARAASVHRRVAIALEARADELAGGQPDRIAYHYLRGADDDTALTAIDWARRGADAARRTAAFDEAVQLLTEAVDVHDRLLVGVPHAPDDLACQLRLDLAEAHDRAGQFARRDARYLEAAALARDTGRVDLLTRAALGYGGRLPAAPFPDPTARALLEEALDQLRETQGQLRALVLARLSQLCHFEMPYDRRQALSDEAISLARRLDDPIVLAQTLLARCHALEGPDTIEESLAVGAEVGALGEQTGDPDLRLQGMRLRISALLATGRHDEARKLADSFALMARQLRHQDHLRLATMWDIFRAGLEGRYEEVETLTEQLTAQLRRTGHRQGRQIGWAYSLVPRWLHGELEKSRPVLDALRQHAPDTPALWAISIWLDVATEDPERALARLDRVEPRHFLDRLGRDFLWLPAVIGCAVAASHGRPNWAGPVHETLAGYRGSLGVTGFAIFFGAIDHHLGTLALVLDRPGESTGRLEHALKVHRELGAAPFVALSEHWLACALEARGDPKDGARAEVLRADRDALVERFGLQGLPGCR